MSSTDPSQTTPVNDDQKVDVAATTAPSDATAVSTATPVVDAPASTPAPAVVDTPAPAPVTVPDATSPQAVVPPPAPASSSSGATPAPAGASIQPHKITQSIIDQFQHLKVHGEETKLDALHRIQSRQSHLSAGILFSDPGLNIMKPIVDALMYDKQFEMPSQIQASTLPVILKGYNLIAQAQSGAGKTIAFSIGLISCVDPRTAAPQGLCIAPTREIAQHIHAELNSIKTRLPMIRTILAVPSGTEERRTERVTEHIIVGTAGTIKSWIQSRALDTRMIRLYVIDEADQMVVQRNTAAESVVIKKALNPNVQTLLFSATYTPEVIKLAKVIVPQAYLIKPATEEELVLDVIFQVRMDVTKCRGGKLQVLQDIYDFLTIQQSIVFVERKADVNAIAAMMTNAGFEVSAIHGDLTPSERDTVMKAFREERTKVLITTNILARGIDIPSVAVVVNYDLPLRMVSKGVFEGDEATYLHRIGRCGRFGRRGTAITFLESPQDHFFLEQIERHYNPKQRMTTEWDPNEIEELSAAIKARPQANLDDTAKNGNNPDDTGLMITSFKA